MIKFRSEILNESISFHIGKKEDIRLKDLKSIKMLDLNPIGIDLKYNKIFLEDLEYFPNLKFLSLSNMHIDIASFAFILRLKNLVSLSFTSCTFQDLSILSNLSVKHVVFINSYIENIGVINRIKNLKELTLIGYKEIDLTYFINLSLTYLELTNSTVKSSNDLNEFSNLSILKIKNTNILDLNFCLKLKNLKELYISSVQYKGNVNIIKILLSNDVNIYIDNEILLPKGAK